MYDEICEAIKADPEIRGMIETAMVPSCYPDPEMKTATIDVGFYLARYYLEERKSRQEEEWFPKEYSPELNVDAWVKLLNDSSVFTTGSLQIMKRMKDYGGQATCTQLAVKYGRKKNFYNSGSSSLARHVVGKTGCEIPPDRDSGNARWWPILYVGKYDGSEEEGSYIRRLRDELSEALDKVDLSGIDLYASKEASEDGHGYWWLTANPKIWSFADIKVGEEQSYGMP